MLDQETNNPFRDTVMEDRVAEILRQKTPAERLEIAFGLWRPTRDMIARVLTSENPDWSPEQIQRETARRMSRGTL